MFGLSFGMSVLLVVLLITVCSFEFINGFHDTANAVSMVIYTNTMKPRAAVIWSAICNFLGVMLGGIGVAIGIVNLIPLDILVQNDVHMSIALILSLVLTAIVWNLATWYFGIPCSSSHTLIGSIFGVGLAYYFMHMDSHIMLPWKKLGDTGLSLLISPFIGFFAAILMLFLLNLIIRKKSFFKVPKEKKKPPFWIRGILLITSTSVSYAHGSNDGQKGVGLMMIILIGLVPAHFSLDRNKNPELLRNHIYTIERYTAQIDIPKMSEKNQPVMTEINRKLQEIKTDLYAINSFEQLGPAKSFQIRNDILEISKDFKTIAATDKNIGGLTPFQVSVVKEEMMNARTFTEYAPWWTILLISISLGLGTMIGWKRIVTTIGEKIGKTKVNYAQATSSTLVAASTIATSSWLGLPVSTTHVLSSGVAGTMVAEGGFKNLQMNTIKNIGVAWLVTLPVTILGSGLLFVFFNWIFGMMA
jgi:PiT family inorganic phosphate transporter